MSLLWSSSSITACQHKPELNAFTLLAIKNYAHARYIVEIPLSRMFCNY